MDPVFISRALNNQWRKLNNKCVLIYNTLIFSVPLSSTALLPHWYFQPILHLHSPAISGFPPGGFHTQVFKLSILNSREGGSRSHQEARRIPKQALQFQEASKGTTKGFSVSHSSRHQKQSLISVDFLHSNLQSKRPDCCPFSTQDAGRPQRWQYNAISLLSGSFNKTSMLKVGLNDLRELFQPEQYSDSIPFSQDGKGAKSFISPSLCMLNWKNWT